MEMVIMSLEAFQTIMEENEIYLKMKEAEIFAELNTDRLTTEEVFNDMHDFIDKL